MVRLDGYDEAQAAPALGRPAPAGRAGARAREPAAGPAARRAARRARPEAPRGDADRAEARSSSEVGITFIYVTHDQEEALTMSDRIAVFNAGPDRAGRHAGRGLRAAGDARSWPASSGPRTSSAATSPRPSSAGAARSRSARRRSGSPTRDADGRGRRAAARGAIRSVVYLGPDTRYVVDARRRRRAGRTQQNLDDLFDGGARAAGPGRPRSIWKRQHAVPSRTAEARGERRRRRTHERILGGAIALRRRVAVGRRVRRRRAVAAERRRRHRPRAGVARRRRRARST